MTIRKGARVISGCAPPAGYSLFIGGTAPTALQTMAKTTKLTATTPTGELITRRTARTYTHAVLVEIELNDGTIYYTDASWCGRPDLAQKALAKRSDFAARLQGTEYRAWDEETRTWQDTGKFRARCTALALPVNA